MEGTVENGDKRVHPFSFARKELVQLTKPLKQESSGIIICISFS